MALRVDLLGDCTGESCVALAEAEFNTLDKPQYKNGVSIRAIEFLDTIEPFRDCRTARKRALRATRKGYRVEPFEPATRYSDMLSINRSLPERQGRKMDDAYVNLRPTTSILGEPKCRSHHVIVYGVFTQEHHRLVAYATIYRCGELVHVSQILGHGDFMDDGIMYLLAQSILADQAMNGDGVFFYNRHDSGTDGLVFYKERIGLRKGVVEWTLGT